MKLIAFKEEDWNHFCDKINWGASAFDARAIKIANEPIRLDYDPVVCHVIHKQSDLPNDARRYLVCKKDGELEIQYFDGSVSDCQYWVDHYTAWQLLPKLAVVAKECDYDRSKNVGGEEE
jgi:hypothetical protein